MRNEVWGWDLPSIINKNVDDGVVQHMLIQVCDEEGACARANGANSQLLFFFQLLELEPTKRINLKDLMCHMFFDPS